jgi:hypothetical protein
MNHIVHQVNSSSNVVFEVKIEPHELHVNLSHGAVVRSLLRLEGDEH